MRFSALTPVEPTKIWPCPSVGSLQVSSLLVIALTYRLVSNIAALYCAKRQAKSAAALSKALGLIPRRWRHPEHRYQPSAPPNNPLNERNSIMPSFHHHHQSLQHPPSSPGISSLPSLICRLDSTEKKNKSNKPNQSPH